MLPDYMSFNEMEVQIAVRQKLIDKYPFYNEIYYYIMEKNFSNTVYILVEPFKKIVYLRLWELEPEFVEAVVLPWIIDWHNRNRASECNELPRVAYVGEGRGKGRAHIEIPMSFQEARITGWADAGY